MVAAKNEENSLGLYGSRTMLLNHMSSNFALESVLQPFTLITEQIVLRQAMALMQSK